MNTVRVVPAIILIILCSFGGAFAQIGSGLPTTRVRADFDGDGKTDISTVRQRVWYILKSGGGIQYDTWGDADLHDAAAPGDWDGDGKTDVAVAQKRFGGTVGIFWWAHPVGNPQPFIFFGNTEDRFARGDYDGDGKMDAAVFRPSNGNWYIRNSSNGVVNTIGWGNQFDIVAPADYDGDGRTDIGIFRPSTGEWFAYCSTIGPMFATWGTAGDKPVPADYDGDGKEDLAVFRPSTGTWYIYRSSDGQVEIVNWGASDYTLVPGDYDGDGKTDIAVYKLGQWFILRSTLGPLIVKWGLAPDVPVPASYVP